MAHPFLDHLTARVDALRTAGLARTATVVGMPGSPAMMVGGRRMLNFAANDYLGLGSCLHWREEVAQLFGLHAPSGMASRLAAGHSALAAEAEAAWAEYFGHEACLFVPSGYQANLAVLTGLLDAGATVFTDRRIHASMARVLPMTGATVLPHAHADMDHLRRRLHAWQPTHGHSPQPAAQAPPCVPPATSVSPHGHPAACPTAPNTSAPFSSQPPVILAESLYSMDGTIPDMAALAALRAQWNAFVILDEAHAIGALGHGGRGLGGNVADVVVGTCGKGLGFFGAFVLMPRACRTALEHLASAVIHSTALPEAHAACMLALLQRLPRLDRQRDHLAAMAAHFRQQAKQAGILAGGHAHIICVEVGDEARATAVDMALRGEGVLALAARYPTVPAGRAIVRFGLTARHNREHIDHAVQALARCLAAYPGPTPQKGA